MCNKSSKGTDLEVQLLGINTVSDTELELPKCELVKPSLAYPRLRDTYVNKTHFFLSRSSDKLVFTI